MNSRQKSERESKCACVMARSFVYGTDLQWLGPLKTEPVCTYSNVRIKSARILAYAEISLCCAVFQSGFFAYVVGLTDPFAKFGKINVRKILRFDGIKIGMSRLC